MIPEPVILLGAPLNLSGATEDLPGRIEPQNGFDFIFERSASWVDSGEVYTWPFQNCETAKITIFLPGKIVQPKAGINLSG